MSIDYTQVEGLTPDQVAALTGLHQADEASLRANRDDIKGEKIGIQERLAASELVIESQKTAALAQEEKRLIAEGSYKEALALRETQHNELVAKSNEQTKIARDALTSRDKGVALASAMLLIHDDYKEVSKDMLSNIVNVTYNDKGEAVTSYKYNGEVVADSAESFNSWAKEQPVFSKILKGVDSSGADTTQSRGGTSLADKGDWSKMSIADKSKYLETKGK